MVGRDPRLKESQLTKKKKKKRCSIWTVFFSIVQCEISCDRHVMEASMIGLKGKNHQFTTMHIF